MMDKICPRCGGGPGMHICRIRAPDPEPDPRLTVPAPNPGAHMPVVAWTDVGAMLRLASGLGGVALVVGSAIALVIFACRKAAGW